MNSKERFIAAMKNEVPDRVPVTPDMSNYIPCKRTGLPFWDIYFFNEVPLWKAYLDAADYFGIEAWNTSCWGPRLLNDRNDITSKVTHHESDIMDAKVQRVVTKTPYGDLVSESTCPRFDPPSPTERPIKDLAKDFKKYKWLLTEPTHVDQQYLGKIRGEFEKRGQAFGLSVGYPGFQSWEQVVEGGIETLTYCYIDSPEILDEWHDLHMAIAIKSAELLLAEKPDYLLLPGSGTITMASPELARRYALPTIQKVTKMAKDAGIPTMLHSCGKARYLVEMLANETDLNSINPLEVAPMGDVDLAEVKRSLGHKISLMGNLHTTEVMLRGSAELVREKSIEALHAAGQGGGYILSTGDQCGRETPDENIFAMVEVAKEFGVYDQATGTLPNLPEMATK